MIFITSFYATLATSVLGATFGEQLQSAIKNKRVDMDVRLVEIIP
jgi:hypothetical protein